jgi:hypothetical protein
MRWNQGKSEGRDMSHAQRKKCMHRNPIHRSLPGTDRSFVFKDLFPGVLKFRYRKTMSLVVPSHNNMTLLTRCTNTYWLSHTGRLHPQKHTDISLPAERLPTLTANVEYVYDGYEQKNQFKWTDLLLSLLLSVVVVVVVVWAGIVPVGIAIRYGLDESRTESRW